MYIVQPTYPTIGLARVVDESRGANEESVGMRGTALLGASPNYGEHVIRRLLLAFALALVGALPMVCYTCCAAGQFVKINAIP